MENKILLDNYTVGDETVYGLKTPIGILLPIRAANTRWNFANQKQAEIIITLAKRLQNGYSCNGNFALESIDKINQCARIKNYYLER